MFLFTCKNISDHVLYVNLQFILLDRSIVKLVPKQQLLKEKEDKKKLETEKLLEKERRKLEQLALEKAREEQKKIPPSEMFKMEDDKYSQFDDKV